MDPRGYGCNKCLKEDVVKLRYRYILKKMEKHLTNMLQMNAYTRTSKVAPSTSLQKRVYLQMIIWNCAIKFPKRDSLNSGKCKHSPPKIRRQMSARICPVWSEYVIGSSHCWICSWESQDGQVLGDDFFCWQTILIRKNREVRIFPNKDMHFSESLRDFLVVWMLGWNHIFFVRKFC